MKLCFSHRILLPVGAAVLFLASCTAPRTVYHSGKVTPRGQVRVGVDVTGNIPSATTSAILDNIDGLITTLASLDSIKFENNQEALNNVSKSVLAYTLDPIGAGYDLHLQKSFEVDKLTALQSQV